MTTVAKQLSAIETDSNHKGYYVLHLYKCLLLQFMEDTSYCTVFSCVRKRIGTQQLSGIFTNLPMQLKQKWIISEVFSFVDATHLIAKASLWNEWNKAIGAKYGVLNNEVLSWLPMIIKLQSAVRVKANIGTETTYMC